MTMSKHARYDRTDRLVYIAMTIGFGEVLFERVLSDKRERVTDTGVLLVKALNEDFLITAFILDMDKAMVIYHHLFGDKRMPDSLYKTIRNNRKHQRNQNKVKF